MQNIILLSISALFALGYIIPVTIKYGVQPSISDTYRLLPKKWKWTFTFFIWGTVLPLVVVAQTDLMTFSAFVMCFVGVTPRFWIKMEGNVHVVAAIGGIAFELASFWYDFHLWYVSVPFVVIYVIAERRKLKNRTYWIESLGILLAWIILYIYRT